MEGKEKLVSWKKWNALQIIYIWIVVFVFWWLYSQCFGCFTVSIFLVSFVIVCNLQWILNKTRNRQIWFHALEYFISVLILCQCSLLVGWRIPRWCWIFLFLFGLWLDFSNSVDLLSVCLVFFSPSPRIYGEWDDGIFTSNGCSNSFIYCSLGGSPLNGNY